MLSCLSHSKQSISILFFLPSVDAHSNIFLLAQSMKMSPPSWQTVQVLWSLAELMPCPVWNKVKMYFLTRKSFPNFLWQVGSSSDKYSLFQQLDFKSHPCFIFFAIHWEPLSLPAFATTLRVLVGYAVLNLSGRHRTTWNVDVSRESVIWRWAGLKRLELSTVE